MPGREGKRMVGPHYESPPDALRGSGQELLTALDKFHADLADWLRRQAEAAGGGKS